MHARRLAPSSNCSSCLGCRRPAAQTLLDASARYLHCGAWRHNLPETLGASHYKQDSGGQQRRAWTRGQVIAPCATASEVSSSASASISDSVLSTRDETSTTSVNDIFTSPNGRQWRVRPYDNSDYGAVIEVQTDSFHTTNPVPFLNQLTYNNFRAEVVDALRQKTKYGDSSTFQLLVAEEVSAPASQPSSQDAVADASANSSASRARLVENNHGLLVGAVEVSIMRDWVLRTLPRQARLTLPVDEYAYISSMCVRTSQRRRGVAQALMAAAEAQARLWRQPHLALHVYKDNVPAVELYRRCGMRVIAEDPGWKALLGGRVRLLMYKELSLDDEGWESATGDEDS